MPQNKQKHFSHLYTVENSLFNNPLRKKIQKTLYIYLMETGANDWVVLCNMIKYIIREDYSEETDDYRRH